MEPKEEEDEEAIIERRRKQREELLAKLNKDQPKTALDNQKKNAPMIALKSPTKVQPQVTRLLASVSREPSPSSRSSVVDSLDAFELDGEDDFEAGLKDKLKLTGLPGIGGRAEQDQEMASKMDKDPDWTKRIGLLMTQGLPPGVLPQPKPERNVDIFADVDMFGDDYQVMSVRNFMIH